MRVSSGRVPGERQTSDEAHSGRTCETPADPSAATADALRPTNHARPDDCHAAD